MDVLLTNPPDTYRRRYLDLTTIGDSSHTSRHNAFSEYCADPIFQRLCHGAPAPGRRNTPRVPTNLATRIPARCPSYS